MLFIITLFKDKSSYRTQTLHKFCPKESLLFWQFQSLLFLFLLLSALASETTPDAGA